MDIIGFDLGSYRTGFARGEAGSKPLVQTWLLRRKGDPMAVAARNLACTLRDQILLKLPDLIAVEDFLNPEAQNSADAAIAALGLHFSVQAVAGLWGIRVEATHPDTIRKHFCGRSSAMGRSRGPKTSKQKQEARDATKKMVIDRAVMLGMLPRGTTDNDKADACAVFDHASFTFARVAPKALVMFGSAA